MVVLKSLCVCFYYSVFMKPPMARASLVGYIDVRTYVQNSLIVRTVRAVL